MGRPRGEAGIGASGLVLPVPGWATWRELSVGLGIFTDTIEQAEWSKLYKADLHTVTAVRSGYGSGREEPLDVSRTASFVCVSVPTGIFRLLSSTSCPLSSSLFRANSQLQVFRQPGVKSSDNATILQISHRNV